MNIILVGHLAFMAVSLGVAIFMRFLKADKINPLVGYRTALSVKNEGTWAEANRQSAGIQLWMAIAFCVLSAGSYIFIGGLTSFYLCSFLLALTSILVIPITEYNLKRKFDSNGNRRD
ncbi:SdpI family protein [Dyadobacter sp. CY326]|uniref:SdpI family protein n=1 Tax=Dyadobacter sp. CY326 TaxID=2907300 RepID=UPI001F1D539C|nr:SdpI family protein [Dyadobacter sp. CY326]MCE7063875.1 SdpI family protein [Dyadobacter sp. CY326]